MSNLNPIIPTTDYVSRDYLSLRADMIRLIQARLPQWRADNPADFWVALVEAFAYSLDILNYYLDRIANESYLDTAVQRESLFSIARMFNYSPKPAAPSTVYLTFLNSTSQPVTLPRLTRCQASVDTGGSGALLRNFETDESLTLGPGEERQVPATEGRTYRDEVVGISNGFVGQRFPLPRASVLPGTVKITTELSASDQTPGAFATSEWVEFDDLAKATEKDFAYEVRQQTDGTSVVHFGNGTEGRIPAMHTTIRATYRVGGGTDGNVAAGSITSIAEPVVYGVSVTNQSPAEGGLNPESLNSIRRNAAKAFRARDRAVTIEDYRIVATSATWVSKAKAVGNSGSSVTMYVVPQDDGTGEPVLSEEERSKTLSYLEARAMAGVTISVFGANWVPVYKKITLVVSTAASKSAVEKEAEDRLAEYYSFEFEDFNGRVATSDIVAVLLGIDGLEFVEVTELSTDSAVFDPGYDENLATADTIWLNQVSPGSIHLHRAEEHTRFTVLDTDEASL